MVDLVREPSDRRRRLRRRLAVAIVVGAAVSASSIAVARMDPAAVAVERASVWTGTVERGELAREVRAPGTLVPDRIRWVTAVTAGRVERISVRSGDEVEPNTILFELDNPELELAALEAESARAAAHADLANLRATLGANVLAQESALATVDSEFSEARRTRAANEKLMDHAAIPGDEHARAREKFAELSSRRSVETRRLGVLRGGRRAQVSAERTRLHGLQTVAEFRRNQVDALRIRAGFSGVLQELEIEEGQWVKPGDVLAKVADPTTLKAELRVAQVQAKDIVRGQPVSVDTRAGVVPGEVTRVDPSVREGTVEVDVALHGELPSSARPDLAVEGIIEVERLPDVVFVARPVHSQPEREMTLFKLTPDHAFAERTAVEFGRGSATAMEVVAGLLPGDTIILSDTSRWDDEPRIELQ